MKKEKSQKKRSSGTKINLIFIMGIAIIQLLSIAIVAVTNYVLVSVGVIKTEDFQENFWIPFLLLAVACVTIGIVASLLVGKFVLNPYQNLMDSMIQLSSGDYSTRIAMKKNSTLKSAEESFNTLAEELSRTEMLRSDFINNFSHEFKTPIASISGLLELLKRDDLPTEKKKEYISIIEEETKRLLEMSTKVLNLSKVENEKELKNLKKYNLSEQIRTCIVLLEKKWEKKYLSLNLDFDEYEIRANYEMMMQVWINILDNAIKFAEENSELSVDISRELNFVFVKITNTGPSIKEEDREKIFTKFFQSDNNKTKDGNGIGLSIVKHIVTLHNGTVKAKSKENKTTFTVKLPI